MQQTLAEIQDFKGKYPKQLWYLFFSEMWERFCFYGMRGMLTVFMVSQLMMKEDVANLQYGATQAFVYAFTFIGGLFADKILGFRKSLFWGGLLMITGSCILAFNPHEFFFLGITLTVVEMDSSSPIFQRWWELYITRKIVDAMLDSHSSMQESMWALC